MELLFLIALGFCLKTAVDYASGEAKTARAAKLKDIKGKHPNIGKTRRSAMLRRHDAGYWAGALVHGFPEARHGFAAGWHAHKSARDEALVMRAKAKADHHENRVSVLKQIAGHRERMRTALKEQQQREEQVACDFPGDDTKTGQPAEAPPRHLRSVPAPPKPDAKPDAAREGWDAPLPASPERAPGRASDQAPAPGTWYSDGSGWHGSIPPDTGWPTGVKHQRNGTKGSDEAVPEPPASSPASSANDDSTPATTGAPMPATAETTYSQDIAAANAIVAEQEQHLADLKNCRWMDRVESLAGAGVDSSTLSAAADMNDSLNAQIKAAEQTIEHTTAFRDSLIAKHQAGHEYHSGTQGGGAEKTYLTD